MHLRSTLLLLGLPACNTGPVLMAPAPVPLGAFSLADSAGVVGRVRQLFTCSPAPNARPIGTLGWRRDSSFVDVTLMQDVERTGPDPAPRQMCYKGFRVQADGTIFALPVKDWPYTLFQKRPRGAPRL